MSLNLVSFRSPSYLCWSDACPTGMGGNDHLGNAWRFSIPDEYRTVVSSLNNCLEFLASIITVWQAILHNNSMDEECFLSLGENTSSVGWLHRANMDDKTNLPLFIATRKYAKIILSSCSCLYSQHIPGSSNKVTDALSRRFDLSDSELTTLICSSYLHQVPISFRICPVHQEISSRVICWLQICKDMKGSPKTQRTRNPEHGSDGANIQSASDLMMMFGSPSCLPNSKSTSWEPLLQPFKGDTFQD